MPIREGVNISEKDAQLYDKYKEEAEYYNRIQYVYKILLNSHIQGALCSNMQMKIG